MKGLIMRGAAVVLFAGLAAMGGAGASTIVPPGPCVDGQQTTTDLSNGYILWERHNGSWTFMLQYYCDSNGCIPL